MPTRLKDNEKHWYINIIIIIIIIIIITPESSVIYIRT